MERWRERWRMRKGEVKREVESEVKRVWREVKNVEGRGGERGEFDKK